jgi:hypothetical protein
METPLEKLLSELRQRGDLSTYSEEQAKHSIILPSFISLDWDVSNPQQVVAEYPIESKNKGESNQWVDYCLKIPGGNKVFIEAKRLGEGLENHEHQLLNYAFRFGVSLAALTTGVE